MSVLAVPGDPAGWRGAQLDAINMIAAGAPLAAGLGALAGLGTLGGQACIILLTDPGGSRLHIAAASGLGGDHPFALDGVTVGPDGGPCGRAIWRGSIVVADEADVRTPERRLADRAQLAGCWAAPLPTGANRGRQGVVLALATNAVPEPAEIQELETLAALVAIAVDRERDSTELDRQRRHDGLTGLVNRGVLVDRLRAALARSGRLATASAVLFVDLDRFKAVNDSLGHDAGDRLLVALAERLKRAMRPGDTVGRLGADEFVVVCEDVGGDYQALSIARDLAEVVAKPFSLSGQEVFLTACIGIAVGGDERGAEELLRDADAATARAKERGPNHFQLFDEDMRSNLVQRMETHNGLRRRASGGNWPLSSSRKSSCRRVASSALRRSCAGTTPSSASSARVSSSRPRRSTGLIVPIGAWVIQEACAQLVRWRPVLGGRPFTLWVNVSGRQMAQPDLPETVADALSVHNLEPRSLGLEITESVIMEDAEAASAHLRALRNLGVGLAIDDFGTGYSSLAYLKRFPVDLLKVDRSFVNGIVADADDASIVAAVIGLARVLGKDVVAEGVEEAEQIEALLGLGCAYGQGYFFARPQPAEAVDELLRAGVLGREGAVSLHR